MYDEYSLSILRALAVRGPINSHVLRRETGLEKHLIENRVRADGILTRAGLVEVVGYDENTRFSTAPKVLDLTEYAREAMQYGFLYDAEDEGPTEVVLDREQIEELSMELYRLRGRFDQLAERQSEHLEEYDLLSDFIVQELYFEVAMLRVVLEELGVSIEYMGDVYDHVESRYSEGINLREDFYQ
ncbi:hypothetical protein N0B31_17730 [Salinirubellus salinus]|uniref:Uncharacterized protein n=1 Tax=Salinirubellus salinus TaxID=1364945 RepID=A0A9E7R1V0_9EURY|nr:hypothetical protein [Salinirubellus salinus]UWM53953.1 hypothetical protein N0B31_17730 [Salinirubellus salinus]